MEFNNWEGKIFSEVVLEFATFLDTVKEIYYKNKDIEVEMNKKQQDLLHTLEFEDLKYHDIAKVGKELKQLRMSRREYKNEYLLSEPIKDFVKKYDNDKFITELKELSSQLKNKADLINAQYYVKKSKIENISSIKKDSNKESDKMTEEIIQLNRILTEYCRSLEHSIEGVDETYNCPTISVRMQMDNKFNLDQGKALSNNLAKAICKCYKPNGRTITVSTSTSDMLMYDTYSKAIIMSKIIINDTLVNKPIYVINLKLREGTPKNDNKNNSKKNKKNKKGGKKKK